MNKYTINREEALLLVIDIQERLVPAMSYGERVIKNTGILIDTSKELDIPVIVTEQYPRGLGSTVKEIKEKLDKDSNIFEKISFSAYNNELKNALEKTNKKKIIISGMETHVCVFQTVRDLLNDNYQVFIVKDGVASRKKDNFINAIQTMKSMGAIISDTETLVFDLLKSAGTPEFKNLSKLIK